MPRNGSGVYSLPQAAFVPNTTISSAAVNSDLSDIGGQLTNSLAADGQTTMTGQIKAMTGAAATPSYTFGSQTNMGYYNAGANTIGVAIGGVSIGTLSSSGFTGNVVGNVTGTLTGPSTGVTDGSSAASGIVGEYLSAVVQRASPVPLTASTNANVTSLAVSAGDWDIWGDCYFRTAVTDNGAFCSAALSLVSATFPATLPFARGVSTGVFTSALANDTSVTGLCLRFSFASPTTVFLVAVCANTITGAYGQIQARRRR